MYIRLCLLQLKYTHLVGTYNWILYPKSKTQTGCEGGGHPTLAGRVQLEAVVDHLEYLGYGWVQSVYECWKNEVYRVSFVPARVNVKEPGKFGPAWKFAFSQSNWSWHRRKTCSSSLTWQAIPSRPSCWPVSNSKVFCFTTEERTFRYGYSE